jgi:hypothetical protein
MIFKYYINISLYIIGFNKIVDIVCIKCDNNEYREEDDTSIKYTKIIVKDDSINSFIAIST